MDLSVEGGSATYLQMDREEVRSGLLDDVGSDWSPEYVRQSDGLFGWRPIATEHSDGRTCSGHIDNVLKGVSCNGQLAAKRVLNQFRSKSV